jgi:hypothetical protein
MSAGTWIGQPVVRRSDTMVEIEQSIDFGAYMAWESWRVEQVDGGIEISNRGGGVVHLPPHVVPLIIDAVASLSN